MPSRDDYLRYLRSEIDRVVELAAAVEDWSAPVPGCPEWTLHDLLEHVGRVHRTATEAIETGQAPQRDATVPAEPTGLPGWLADGGERLLKVLDDDPARHAWSFVPGTGTVGFWQRRLALENALHRRDVETSIASPTPVPVELAVAGVGEVVYGTIGLGITRGQFTLPAGACLALRATETGTTWQVGAGPRWARLEGPAEQLFLLLWKRLEVSESDLTYQGDLAAGHEILSLPLTP